jgi:hypothetical protein
LNKRGIIILSVCIAIVLIATSSVLGLYIFRWADNVQTGDLGLNFSLDSHLISVPQRGSTEVHFTVWLDSQITSETPINLTVHVLTHLDENDTSLNFTVSPDFFNLRPNQRMNCVLTISPGDQTPASKYRVMIDSPIRFDNESHGWETRGYLAFTFVVTHWVPPNTASIDYWLDGGQSVSASGDSFLTIHCKNWGNTDGTFNLTAVLGNAEVSDKTVQPYCLFNSSVAIFPVTLHAGEDNNINIHFTFDSDSEFNITLSLASEEENLCVEPLYKADVMPCVEYLYSGYHSLSYHLIDNKWRADVTLLD